jgi:preprotein translocase subunit SecG
LTLFIFFHVFICIFLIGVILLQPGKSDAGVTFGSSSQSIFGSKGAGNFLTRTTSVIAILFLLTSFILTRSRIRESTGSVIDSSGSSKTKAIPAVPVPKPDEKAPQSKAPDTGASTGNSSEAKKTK